MEQCFRMEWMNAMEDPIKTLPDSSVQKEVGSSRSDPSKPEATEGCSSKNRYLDITAMIRSLQRTEGSSDCFRRGIADCDQLTCSWRQYCLNRSD
jgi:hypothetical protein